MKLVRPENSTPGFGEFNPLFIPYQSSVIDLIKYELDFNLGVHQILLSGSAGSAKSILMAHLLVRHCLEWPKARALIGRRSLPDLKDTLYQKIKEHLMNDKALIEDKHYHFINNIAKIEFGNGSEIISRSWSDLNFMKFRSLELSMVAIEELTENSKKYKKAYDEICMRLNRLPHVKENYIISATNPDGPAHWVYGHFELHLDEHLQKGTSPDRSPLKHVFYSETKDNIFLAPSYLENMKENLDEKMFQRMGKGRWIEIASETIYYAYNKSRNFINKDHEIRPFYPIHITWDFNIGKGKPLSLTLFQFIGGVFHFFDEVVIHGADTEESCQELAARGLLDHVALYCIHGDATGEKKSTTSKASDYDIIKKFLSNYRTKRGTPISFQMEVPKSNPPIKTRHNWVNGYCYNANKTVRLLVYRKCKTLDEGLRLASLVEGGQYIEDDKPAYQHVTTAAGYGICWVHAQLMKKPSDAKTVKWR